jgi:hypothetical protein
MANLLKTKLQSRIHRTIALSSVILLSFAASDLYCQDSLDNEIARALKKAVKCEKVEIKSKTEDNKGGKLKSLLIKFSSISQNILPADFVTMQYTNPRIDLKALKSNKFKVTSHSDYKVGMLVSEQSLKSEFDRRAKKQNFRYDSLQIKFTPPYIEVKFDFPVSSVPLKDRKIVEKFARNNRYEGYAALRLEVRDNKVFASPEKIILNHFLLPSTVVAEIRKRVNPVYRIPRLQTFDYTLAKAEILKQYIYFSN